MGQGLSAATTAPGTIQQPVLGVYDPTEALKPALPMLARMRLEVVPVDAGAVPSPSLNLLLADLVPEGSRRVIRAVQSAVPDVVVVAVAAASGEAPEETLRAGVQSVCHHGAPVQEIVATVMLTLAGSCCVPASTMNALLDQVRTKPDLRTLGAKERAWLERLRAGATVSDLAESCGRSIRSMRRDLRRVYDELGVDSLRHALRVVEAGDPVGP